MKKTSFIIYSIILAILYWASIGNLIAFTTAEQRLESYNQHLKMKENSRFKDIEWTELGPYFLGGRITDIEVNEKNPYKFYIGAASGGLWVTENYGTTWKSIFDNESSITIGDVATSETDENLIWIGSGENNSGRSIYAGTGVFKSIDGGKTWQNMGLTDTHHIGRIIIDRRNNNIVYVAAMGHLYTKNEERGLFKTIDGGKTWEKILYINPGVGCIDLAMDPKNGDILYTSTWEMDRKAWNFSEGGIESAIYKSIDGGKTWKKIVKGLPQSKYVGRIGLAIAPSNVNVIYALLDNQEPKEGADLKKTGDPNRDLLFAPVKGAEVYRSNDGGENWSKVNKDTLPNFDIAYAYYFGQIRVAPDNENTVYALGLWLLKSTDGGKTFSNMSMQGAIMGYMGVHADQHALWINPKNSKHLILGNDGGLNISYDEGASWQKIDNLPIAQCYTVNYDIRSSGYNIYTGLQDNGIQGGPSNFTQGNQDTVWKLILGGDGAFVQPRWDNGDILFASSQFGNIFRFDLSNHTMKMIKPFSPDPKSPYRYNWLTPFLVSSHNPLTIYLGVNKLLKSPDEGNHWIEISPDLTNEKNTEGDIPYATITALDESILSPNLLVAGTDDGNVWIKKDALSTWEKINNGLPVKWVSRIITSAFKKERLYITLTGYRDDDFNTYVFTSEDYGKTWISIKGNLPDEPVNVIREDWEKENIIYLGTDLGIYVSIDRGKSWYSLKGNLPTIAVYDLRIHPKAGDILIGTHGRGVFKTPVYPFRDASGEITTNQENNKK